MAFGESSLDFEVVYYVLDSDYNIYMDIQQAINLNIMRSLEKLAVNLAFPTMTLHFNRDNPSSSSSSENK